MWYQSGYNLYLLNVHIYEKMIVVCNLPRHVKTNSSFISSTIYRVIIILLKIYIIFWDTPLFYSVLFKIWIVIIILLKILYSGIFYSAFNFFSWNFPGVHDNKVTVTYFLPQLHVLEQTQWLTVHFRLPLHVSSPLYTDCTMHLPKKTKTKQKLSQQYLMNIVNEYKFWTIFPTI